ncbi:hypothetical protein NKI25_13185 [Mesorhizobium sp. M0808]|uniref:hypothetical protein n=1 Tax=Mesorhizobium sp. M0808 TaxID=2957002 RepID=UPI00333D42BD
MGIPQHYSHMLPVRCSELVKTLYPLVKADQRQADRHGGPLGTTLLLALATPMIVLPAERILQALDGNPGYSDETGIDPVLTKAVRSECDKRLKETSFFEGLGWTSVSGWAMFDLGKRLPPDLAEELRSAAAQNAAGNLEVRAFFSRLRNGLSHGGIMYLDSKGESSEAEAEMLAFVSGKRGTKQPLCRDGTSKCAYAGPPIESLNILRISESGFREFLMRWATWLENSGAARGLSETVIAAE